MNKHASEVAPQIAADRRAAFWIWLRRPLRLGAHLIPYPVVGLTLAFTSSGWLAMLAYHLTIAVALWLSGGWREALALLRRGWRPWWLLALVLGMGFSSGVALFLLWPRLGVAFTGPVLWAAFGLSGPNRVLFVAYFCLLNPALEESYWRGYLGSPQRRLTLSDVAFGGYHLLVVTPLLSWGWAALIFALLTAAGWFWRQLARLGGGLGLSLAAHAAADSAVMVALLLI
jgi:hypothetical protein